MPAFNEIPLIKLIIYLNGSDTSLYFYSFLRDDKRGKQYAFNALKRRMIEGIYAGKFRMAIFYDNISGNELHRVQPQRRHYDKEKSLSYAIVYLKANPNNAIKLYSSLEDDNQGQGHGIYKLSQRIFNELFPDQTLTVLIYNNDNNILRYKYVNGIACHEVNIDEINQVER
jgi:hypothetical protein